MRWRTGSQWSWRRSGLASDRPLSHRTARDACSTLYITLCSCDFFFLCPPYGIGQAIIFFVLWFLLLSSSFFPRLFSAVADWCGLSANLGCRSETCCTHLAENTGRKKSPNIRHLRAHRTILWGCIFATKARIDDREKLVKQQYLPHMSHNMVNFGPLAAEIASLVWGTPANIQRVLRLGRVTARHLVVGVSQTLRRWTEGATYVRQGDHQVGHWPTFLV